MSIVTNAINANTTTPLPVVNGGTAHNAVVTAPTASTWSGWDANSNHSANNYIGGYQTIATAAGTTTLTVASPFITEFSGSTTQTCVMPVTSTLVLGQSFLIVNSSTGVVTVQSSGTNTIQAMASGTSLLLYVELTSGTTAASWKIVNYSVSDTSYPLSLALGGTGQSLSSVNSAVFSTTGGGAAQLSTTLPSGLAATNMTLTTPSVTGSMTVSSSTNINGFATGMGIGDANNSPVLVVGSTMVSPVNYMVAFNQVTGIPPGIYSKGSDTDVGLSITSQAAGPIYVQSTSSTPLIINSGTAYQHSTNFIFSNTSASRNVTFPDAAGTVTLLGNTSTGSGSVVLATSPTLVTPTLGVASATSINFGGTALANYVEGTWTPTFSFATPGDISVSYSAQNGSYTRIGNQVFWFMSLIFTPTYTTSSGIAVVSGLPVTINAAANYPGSLAFNNVIFTGKFVVPFAIGGGTTMQFLQTTSGAGFNYLTITSFLTGVAYTISASGHYRV